MLSFAESLDAVVYIGLRPVYKGGRILLEAHILEFDENIYGRHIRVELIDKLRNDDHITSEKELIEQIKKDIDKTKKCLKKYNL